MAHEACFLPVAHEILMQPGFTRHFFGFLVERLGFSAGTSQFGEPSADGYRTLMGFAGEIAYFFYIVRARHVGHVAGIIAVNIHHH